jgi:WD40 repeat protein
MRSDALRSRAARTAALGLLALLAAGVCLPWTSAAQEPELPGLVAQLEGHEHIVYGVAFSPDGKYAVTGSFDKTVRVWEAATGKLVREFGGDGGHQRKVLSVSVNHDGTLLASGGEDNRVHLWDFPSGNPVREFALGQPTLGADVTPDGKRLAGAGKDGVVKIFEAESGKELFALKGHSGPAIGVSFNPAGQFLASIGEDQTLRLWNAQNGKAEGLFYPHEGAISAVTFSPANNNLLFTAGADGLLKYWNLPVTPPKPINQPHAAEVTALAISPNYQYLLSASKDKVVRLTTASNGAVTRTLAGAPAAIRSVAMSPNNALAAAGTEPPGGKAPFPTSGRLLIWKNNGQLERELIAHEGAVTGVDFHPGSNQLLTVGADGQLRRWLLPTQKDRVFPHPAAVLAAAASADRQRIFTGGQDKILRRWVVSNPGNPERQFSGHTAEVTAVAISPNNAVLVSGSADQTLRFWDQNNGQTTALIGAHEKAVTSLSFHPNNQYVLSASEDGTLKLWQTPHATGPSLAHSDQATCAVLSPDGNALLTGSNDKQVRLWNTGNGQLMRTFGGNALAVQDVAMSGNGALVASGGADQSLRIWEAGSGKEVKKFEKLGAAVRSVALSPDGTLAACGLANNTLLVFDLKPPKDPQKPTPPKKLAGHGGAVEDLAFTAKGDQLISACADKNVRVWDLAGGKVVRTLSHGAAVSALALSKDSKLLASGGADKAVKLWTLADGKLQATITTPAAVQGVSLSPDGKQLAVAGQDNRARVYDLDGQMREFFPHDGPVTAALFHNDGKRILTTSADKTARIWTTSLLWQAKHEGPVRQAILSPNGALVVSVGDDKVVRIFNAADGKPLHTLTGSTAALTGVGISADNLRVAAAGADGVLRLWAVPKPGAKALKPIEVKLSGPATALALSNDGKRVAVGNTVKGAGEVHVYDTASGLELQTLARHQGAVHALAFQSDNRTVLSAGADKQAVLADANADAVVEVHKGGASAVSFANTGNQALTAGADKTMKVWNLADGKLARTFGPFPEAVSAATYSRDSQQVAGAVGKTVHTFNAGDGKALQTLTQPSAVTSLSFSADKTRLVTGGMDNKARIWDLKTGKVLEAFAHAGPVRGVAYYSDNRVIISGSDDKSVVIHRAHAVRVVDTGAPVRALAMTSNGSHVLAAGADGKVRMFNAGNGNLDRTFEGGPKAAESVAVSRNNVLVAVGCEDQTVRLHRLDNAQLLKSWKAPAPVRSLSFTPDSLALVGAMAKGGMESWDVRYNNGQPPPETFGKRLMAYEQKEALGAVQFPRSGNVFYTAGPGPAVRAWKIPSDRPVRTLNHRQMVDAVAFAPSGTTLATGGHDGQVRIFDVTNGRQVRAIAAHKPQEQGYIYCLAWSPDGKYLVSGSNDKSAKLWDASSGKMVREFKAYSAKDFPKGHREAVFCLAFSPDGKFLATGSSDRTIKLWDVSNGQVVREFANPGLKAVAGDPVPAHPGWVYGVRFTPDGKHLVSAGRAPRGQGYLAVWEVGTGKLLSGKTLALGPVYSEALSPDGDKVLLGTGGVNRETLEPQNKAYLVRLAALMK